MNYVKRNALVLAALQLAAVSAVRSEEGEAPKFDLATETRQGVNLDREHALSELTVQAGFNWKPAAGWRVSGRARAQVETELEPSEFRQIKVDESYLEYAGNDCNIRFGVQQVVWGGADRLRVLDLVHPLDLRENLFGDPVQSRRPLGMFNTECTVNVQSMQWLLIPHSRNNLRTQTGSRFSTPLATDRIAAANITVLQGESPDWKDPKDWSVGLKWGGRLGSADVTLNALHGWQGDPVIRLQSDVGAPAYRSNSERFSMAGGSITAPVGPFVFKAEASIVPNAHGYFQTAAKTINATRSQERRAMVGLDYQAMDWFLSTQYYVQHNSAVHKLIEPEWQKIVTFAARREFLQGRLNLTVFVAHDLVNPAQYISIATKYDVSTRWQSSLALDYFHGKPLSVGRFRPESRLVFTLRYDFI